MNFRFHRSFATASVSLLVATVPAYNRPVKTLSISLKVSNDSTTQLPRLYLLATIIILVGECMAFLASGSGLTIGV